MAYRSSSSRSAGRGGGARGGRPAPRRGGGNPAATVGAIVVVVGVIAAIVLLSSKKDKPKPPQPANTPPPASSGTTKPPEPQRPPPPPISEELKAQAKALVADAQQLAKRGEAIYAEAIAAKDRGDQDLWQEKLREAQDPFQEVLDRWNELIAQMPTDLAHDWDEEEVANYHLGKEGDQITRLIGRLHDITKQMRLR